MNRNVRPHLSYRPRLLALAVSFLLYGGGVFAGTTNLVTEVTILDSNPGSVRYVNFNVSQSGTFQIDALGEDSMGVGYNGDPQIRLFHDSLDLANLVASDDDSGMGLDSQIVLPLPNGSYILAVSEFSFSSNEAVNGDNVGSIGDPNTLIRVQILSDDGLAYLVGSITLQDLQESLSGTASGGHMALTTANLLLYGAHGRPLARRVAAGQNTFWLAGDWGRDDHGARDGDLGLAEFGFGKNFGPAQVNISLGQTWAKQNQVLNGRTKTDGTYLLAEALMPVKGSLWATLGAYYHSGNTDLRRGYLNAGVQDFSTGTPDVDTWSVRGRLEWDGLWQQAGAAFSPYADLTYSEAKLDAYTETGGGFPARFDARKEKATELHLGVNAEKPLNNGMNLFGTLEATHRFEDRGARTSGQVIGLFPFDLPGQKNKQDWLRLGAGVEGKLAEGRASLSLNLTTKGETPNAWLAANWQKAF